MIVLAVHHVEVFYISISYKFNLMFLVGTNWRPMLPIILAFLLKGLVFCRTIRRRLIQILYMIRILSLTNFLVEVLLILLVIVTVVLAIGNMMAFVPSRWIKRFRRHLICGRLLLVLDPTQRRRMLLSCKHISRLKFTNLLRSLHGRSSLIRSRKMRILVHLFHFL